MIYSSPADILQATPGWVDVHHVLPGAETSAERTPSGAEDARSPARQATPWHKEGHER